MRNILKRLTTPILQKVAKRYLAKERSYVYNDIKVQVLPGVFHPGLFLSTKVLLDLLDKQDLTDKTFLEVGAGSGIVSILAQKKGAIVTALEINPTAVENIEINIKLNAEPANERHKWSIGDSTHKISIVESDLFDNLPLQQFDWVVINPPYYPKAPKNDEEKAWFCGPKFEYFQKLFAQLPDYLHTNSPDNSDSPHHSQCIMILSEDCDLERIQAIATKQNFVFTERLKKKVMGEWNIVFDLSLV